MMIIPSQLIELRQPPLVLFYKGNKNLLKSEMVAIVGSREVVDYGERMTIEIVNNLKSKYVTVSGLAKGVDSLVHQYSLKTIGVLGCGIDYCYPSCNKELYDYMSQHQLIISEYPGLVKPYNYNFPFRNRIIAALGSKLIVTQATLKSGTMLTVNEALNLNRDVYAVAYRLTDEFGQGCNSLIMAGCNMIEWDNNTNHVTNLF